MYDRSGPFHCSWYCHVKPVSETSLSPKYRQKHHSTRAAQTNAKLEAWMFSQQSWNSCVCWAPLEPWSLNELGKREGGRENPVSIYSKVFGLVVTRVILTMFPQPAEGLRRSLSAEFILMSFMGKRNVPDVWRKLWLSCFPTKYFCSQGGKNIVEVFLDLMLNILLKLQRDLKHSGCRGNSDFPFLPRQLKHNYFDIFLKKSFLALSANLETMKTLKL